MKHSRKRLWVCTALIIAILAFIWGNSLMSAEISHNLSEWVKRLLKSVLSDSPVTREESRLVRKLAHFAEFAALGACLAWRRGMLRKPLSGAFAAGAAAAVMDETIQLFVPNRGPGVADVLLDSCGVLTGMLFLYLGHTLLNKRKNTK